MDFLDPEPVLGHLLQSANKEVHNRKHQEHKLRSSAE